MNECDFKWHLPSSVLLDHSKSKIRKEVLGLQARLYSQKLESNNCLLVRKGVALFLMPLELQNA